MGAQQFLLLCGAIAGPLFIILFLIEGALRPAYNSMRQPVSALSIGPRGWIQRTNFIVAGLLMLAYAYGLRLALQPYGASFWEYFLIAIYTLGLIGAGIFVTDVSGMSSNNTFNTFAPSKRTTSSVMHDIFSLFVFVPLVIDAFIFAHFFAASGSVSWMLYCVVSGTLSILGFVLFARGFAGAPQWAPIAGLLQRLTIAIGWLGLSLLAVHFLGIL